MYAIEVKELTKKFKFTVRDKNKNKFFSFFKPIKKEVIAVNNISFKIEQGESVAFIGPNGAGKSTTIKTLSGILYPTSGIVNVLGMNPNKDMKKLSYKIGTIFGQRSSLLPNLPLTDSMELFGLMYDLNKKEILKRIQELTDIFELGSFIDKPVRKLSLGERMRAEIACALIHKPKIIFLDEPTIGLDVVAKNNLRMLLKKINKEGTTIFLTSHDMDDILSVCERTIIIDKGLILLDLPTNDIVKQYSTIKTIEIKNDKEFSKYKELPNEMKYILKSKNIIKIKTNNDYVKKAINILTDLYEYDDITITDDSLEEVIRCIYEQN